MFYFSNENVFRGHPDKVCDQISDAILVDCLTHDQNAKTAVEVVGGKNKIFVTGEITTTHKPEYEKIIKRVLRDVGYNDDIEIEINIGEQSPDIALGTNEKVGGAGDNGMMFGFATNETEELLPTAQVILQNFCKAYDHLRKKDDRFKPDGKIQITGKYNDKWELKEIKSVTICYQNIETQRKETDEIIKQLFESVAKGYKIKKYFINPTGKFYIGGFDSDAGLTGRKIVVDNYQGFAPVGGGAFSGKDPSKVDRSGAYKARSLAKRILKEQGVNKVNVQVSYAIGKKQPLAIYINTDKGTIKPSKRMFREFEPNNIIRDLNLKNLEYEKMSAFGHFTGNKEEL